MRTKHNAIEVELDLTAQQLLAPLGNTVTVLEIDDVGSVEAPAREAVTSPAEHALDETSEIELTAEEIDAMLEGRWP